MMANFPDHYADYATNLNQWEQRLTHLNTSLRYHAASTTQLLLDDRYDDAMTMARRYAELKAELHTHLTQTPHEPDTQ
jgi:hypothetical protein